MTTLGNSKLAFITFFITYFLTLWILWETPAVYPIKIFVVFLHEVSHGLMALATGGRIDQIILDTNQGGTCFCPDGNSFLTLTAGYLGSLLWGVSLVAVARQKHFDPRYLNVLVSTIVMALTMAYLKTIFAILFGLGFALALLFVAIEFSKGQNRMILLTLGLTSCLYAFLDIKSDILDRPAQQSDAAILYDLTGLPVVFWGVVWMTIAIYICSKLITWLYHNF